MNGLTFFSSGKIAYITKQFEIASDRTKINLEDFSLLTSKTSRYLGKDFKYIDSYEYLTLLIQIII
jgi:hypothetical protein